MIGHRMLATLSETHETIGVIRRESLGDLSLIPGIKNSNFVFGINAYDLAAVSKVINDYKPQVVLNCIGIVKQLKDSSDHLKSISMNALFPHQLAKICADHNARMIQFSSDCVFDGLKGHYVESDMPNATDLYGKSKALGEIDYLPNVVTMRTSSIGREVFPHGGLIEWFLSNKDKTITGYKKAIYSGFPTKRLANIISSRILPNEQVSGIVHVAGEAIDKWTLLKMIQDHFQLKMQIDVNDEFVIDRSLNYSLFAKETDFVAPTWKEMIKDLEVDFEIYELIRNKNVYR